MYPLQRQQLKLHYDRNYNLNKKQFINIDEIKRANQYRTSYYPQIQTSKLLNHMIRNRKQQYQGHTDQFLHYEEFQNRINNVLSQTQKNDHTTVQLIYEDMDADKDGLISQEDFLNYFLSIGSVMNQQEVYQLFELMTVEGTHLTKKQVQMILEKGI